MSVKLSTLHNPCQTFGSLFTKSGKTVAYEWSVISQCWLDQISTTGESFISILLPIGNFSVLTVGSFKKIHFLSI